METNTVIVFGIAGAGLFLARELKKKGCDVIAIGKKDDIGKYSNSIKKFYKVSDATGLESALDDILKNVSGKPQGYICSDTYLTMIIEEKPQVFEKVDFKEPGEKLLRLIYDKEALMDYARKSGVVFPDECDLDKPEDIKFPVAIKPNIKRGESPIKKISILKSPDELKAFLENARSFGLTNDKLVAQKAITGDNRFEYGFGGYFKNGIPVKTAYFRQLRQYPQGVCCYAIEIVDSEIIEKINNQLMPFLKRLKYSGFVQFDLKEDPETGDVYTLDINPRPWGSVGILRDSDVFNAGIPKPTKTIWRFPVKELMSFRKEKNVPYSECRKYKSGAEFKTIYDLWDKHDKRPFLMQPVVMLMKLLKIVK